MVVTNTCAINVYRDWSYEFESRSWRCVVGTTLCDKVCQWLTTGQRSSLVSSTNKTDRHDITEIVLKVTLNTITQTFCRDGGFHYLFTTNTLIGRNKLTTRIYHIIKYLWHNVTRVWSVMWFFQITYAATYQPV